MFEFDPAKSAANRAKHGIDFEDAQAPWRDGDRVEVRTRSGDDGEPRSLVIARLDGRFWSAVMTYRGDAVRLISVRRARRDEVMLYEHQDPH